MDILQRRFFDLCLMWGMFTFLCAHEIIIQPDYWTGTECLKNGVPWQVPDSIYKEDELCQPDDLVLEFGAGGSTVFFCKKM